MKTNYILLLLVSFVLHSNAQTLLKNNALKPFYHGVASGDPLSDRVIIWTRFTPENENNPNLIPISWSVYGDKELNDLVVSGLVYTDRVKDFTVKIDVSGLDPNTYYYYQFEDADGNTSLIGRTKTAPENNIENVRFAGVSCSSIYSGYFNAYRRIAERNDIDAVIHIGDYIYDFIDNEERVRVPVDSILDVIEHPKTLDRWRALHAYYKLDPDLRAAHQQHPWLIMWDNHDLQNAVGNAYTPEAFYSIKAFYEWTPTREPNIESFNKFYRKLSYGNLIDVIIMDVSLFRDDQESVFGDEIDNPGRSILGEEQLNWLKSELLNSTAKWRLLCSSKPMGQWHLFGLPNLLPQDLPNINDFGFPFTSSTWDGYPAERQEIYEFLRDNNINNNIAISGDLHTYFFYDMVENPWNPTLYNVGNGGGKPVGAEFVPGSVTRGNMDETFSGFGLPVNQGFADLVESLIRFLNPHNVYMDFIHHGYGILDFRPDYTTGEFWFSDIDIVTSEEKMDASFTCYKDKNRWDRNINRNPLEALSNENIAESAPFEQFDWSNIQSRMNGLDQFNSTPSSNFTYQLSEIYPNPSSGDAWLNFIPDKKTFVNVEIFDLANGKKIGNLYNGQLMAGHTLLIQIDKNIIPHTGYFIVVMKSKDFMQTKKVYFNK